MYFRSRCYRLQFRATLFTRVFVIARIYINIDRREYSICLRVRVPVHAHAHARARNVKR